MGLKRAGVEGVVFGNVDIQEHKEWVERVCGELGVEPIEPLWMGDPKRILIDFINAGFRAIVVKAKADLFGKEWLAREINKDFVKDVLEHKKKFDFHLLGEKGEYHTFVTGGPMFERRVNVIKGEEILKEGHWYLDILEWRVDENYGHPSFV